MYVSKWIVNRKSWKQRTSGVEILSRIAQRGSEAFKKGSSPLPPQNKASAFLEKSGYAEQSAVATLGLHDERLLTIGEICIAN